MVQRGYLGLCALCAVYGITPHSFSEHGGGRAKPAVARKKNERPHGEGGSKGGTDGSSLLLDLLYYK